MAHELCKNVLNHGLLTVEEIQAECDRMLRRQSTLSILYTLEITIPEARREMQLYIPAMSDFMIGFAAKESIMTNDGIDYMIDSIGDIEDVVWVPQLGLTSKVDATVKIRRRNNTFYRGRYIVNLYLYLTMPT